MTLEPVAPTAEEWDRFVARHPAGHVLQTPGWAALKARFGWTSGLVALGRDGEIVAGAQVLYRRLPLGLGRLAYVPKGPLVAWDDEAQAAALLAVVGRSARANGAIALQIEPELPDEAVHRERLRALDLHPSPLGSYQPRRTVVVDLSPDEDGILAAMKQKTRYNVRLADRKGVTVRAAGEADLPAFHALMAATGSRDGFHVHAPAYYDAAFRLFVPGGRARLLLAEVEGEPVAALMAFALPPLSWYMYGASGDAHREKMAPYLLQWEAMRWAKSLGCTEYDLWGIPDEDEETLEARFTQRHDGLWGVYRFKRGFGGRVVRSVGTWDQDYAPVRMRLINLVLALRDHVFNR